MKSNIIKRIWYFGHGRLCPVCGTYARKFDKYGVRARPDALCIHCGSLERHRLVWLYLREKTTLLDGLPHKLLHIAPEVCLERHFIKKLGSTYITADLNNTMANVRMDVTDIPFDDESFDVIYCSHVLEHVPNDRKAFHEFHRVLKKGGWALIVVPINVEETVEDPTVTDPRERERLFGQHDHVRKYGLDVTERIKEAGFQVQTITETDLLTPEQIKIYGINLYTPLFICVKE